MAQAPHPQSGSPLPFADRIHGVTITHVWRWLALGWADYRRSGWVSAAYGGLFAAGGIFITFGLAWLGWPYLITPMIGGFLLIGPLLALGLYAISRAHAQGRPIGLIQALLAWRANTFHIMTAGLVLMLVVMIWARLSIVLFAIFLPYQSMSVDSFLAQSLTMAGISFTLFMLVLGAGFAALVFVTCVVSLPMMLDQKVDIFSAALMSVLAVVRNPAPMALWAMIIVAVIGLGILPLFLGLVVALPVIGHASWHAYGDLIAPPPAN
ncbi:protein of unknown function [Magnetospirillum gryphiswaldense MSR-1 v2]|uniref:Integral membrane protein n=1 Tax=Magnetospirillum gryphiswaldense (strain DSM 6361 / JCM 21280 / NBRC 15271 / MSR-1) TaxID=431944 RepID=V6EXP7_MAGGM|nr:DUF2189 domain-containing protein [Magnetospirillum gryphiswaldense]CDK97974.1 protein of unknown function [Magnetospirillum gryphiswaldense MSR-1 v2]